jgi:hypothetical protein
MILYILIIKNAIFAKELRLKGIYYIVYLLVYYNYRGFKARSL